MVSLLAVIVAEDEGPHHIAGRLADRRRGAVSLRGIGKGLRLHGECASNEGVKGCFKEGFERRILCLCLEGYNEMLDHAGLIEGHLTLLKLEHGAASRHEALDDNL